MKNTITLVVVTLIIAAGAYWYFSSGTGNQSPLTATSGSGVAQSQFKSLVSELQSITFDTSIFSNPSFTALVDLSTPVTPEPSGRIDPFAPLSGATSH